MDMKVLQEAGVDTEDALARLMGSEKLLARLLGKFSQDKNCAALVAATEAADADAAFEAAHALKGVCGNLSMIALYELTSKQCDLLRAGAADEAFALTPQIEAAHRAVLDAIEAAGV